MKKYLLPIVLLAAMGTASMSAETFVDELTAASFGSPSSFTKKVVYTSVTTGITYNAGFRTDDGAMNFRTTSSNVGGIMATENPNNYKLESLEIVFSESTSAYTLPIYASSTEMYEYVKSYAMTTGEIIGTESLTKDAPKYTFTTVSPISFSVCNKNSKVIAAKLIVTWSDGQGSGQQYPTLEFPQKSVTVNYGDTFTGLIVNPDKHGPVTYSSSDTGVATVNATTGAISIVGSGATTITAASAETDEYQAGEASYTLEVLPKLVDNQYYGGLYPFQSNPGWSFSDNTTVYQSAVFKWIVNKDGDNYMQGCGKSNSGTKYAADSKAISPAFTIPEDLKGAQVVFDAAFSEYPGAESVSSYCKILVSEKTGEHLDYDKDPANPETVEDYSSFYPSGIVVAEAVDGSWNTCAVDLSAYVGKKVKIAFNYISSAEVCGTWQFRDVKVLSADGPIVVKKKPGYSFEKTSVTADQNASFSSPMLLNPNNVPGITYSSSVPTVATVDATTGAVKIVSYGTTVITAKNAESDDFYAGEASYTLIVNPVAASAKEMESFPENLEVKIDFISDVVYSNGKYNYIIDKNGNAALIYGQLTNIAKGDVIGSGWKAKKTVFNGLVEIIPVDNSALKATGAKVDVVYPTVAPSYITAENVNKVVTVSNVTFADATPADNKAFTGVSNGETINFFNQLRVASVEAGAYDVDMAIAIRIKDGVTTLQVYPIEYREYIAPVYVSAKYNGSELQNGATITSLVGDEVKVDFTCTEGARIYYSIKTTDSDTAEEEVLESGKSLTFTESCQVSYYAKNAKTQSETYTLNLVFKEIPLTASASYNGDVIGNGVTVETAPGAVVAGIKFDATPEDATVYYSITATADEEPVYAPVPQDGMVYFAQSGYVRYYAERESNGARTDIYNFNLVMSKELPIGPIHLHAYYKGEEIADRAVISAAAGEKSVEVTFVCDEKEAKIYYCFYTYDQTEGNFVEVPEDGKVVFNENGTVKYFAATDNFSSPSFSFDIDVTTGVGTITTSEDTESAYYDLQGRRVKGELLPGIYVEVRNGKATKRIIR